MRTPSGLRLGWAIVVAAAAGALAANVAVLGPRATASSRCETAQPPLDPIETALQFLTTAVSRERVAASYRLATPALRKGASCDAWAKGRLPVQEFRHIDWSRSSYKLVAGGTGQLVLRVYLFSGTAAEVFLMELRQPEGAKFWQVGFWERTAFQPGELERLSLGAADGPAA